MLARQMKRGRDEAESRSAPGGTDVLSALASRRDHFFSFLRRRTASAEDAEDLLQQGFIRATRKISTLRDVELADAWFYSILRRTLADHASTLARSQRLVDEQTKVAEAALGVGEERRTCSCSLKLIEALPPQYAEIIQRIDVVEESVAEVAAALSTTSGNILVRLHRARKALRERLRTSCGTSSSRSCLDCRCQHLA
jgi:RNA polymerase sigma factor (sigma-70 family)